MTAYFMGVHPPERAGHHCHLPGGGWAPFSSKPSPWAGHCDPLGDGLAMEAVWGRLDWRSSQPEGVGRVVHRDGWTLLSCFDRSADERKGSHASFAFDAVLEPGAALAEARRLWPAVWARIDPHLARQGMAFRVECAP